VIQNPGSHNGFETLPILCRRTSLGDHLLPEFPHDLQQDRVFGTVEGVQFHPEFLGQGGAFAAGGDRNRQGASLDDGREDEVASGGFVDDVH